jgi:hypothetical protein
VAQGRATYSDLPGSAAQNFSLSFCVLLVSVRSGSLMEHRSFAGSPSVIFLCQEPSFRTGVLCVGAEVLQ